MNKYTEKKQVEIFLLSSIVRYVIYLTIIALINSVAVIFSRSISLLANALFLAYVFTLSFLVAYAMEKILEGSVEYRTFITLSLVTSLIFLCWTIILLVIVILNIPYSEFLPNPHIAIVAALVSFLFFAVVGLKLEDLLKEHNRWIAIFFGDFSNLLMISSLFPIAGTLLNLLAVLWMEPAMAIVILLILLRETISDTIRAYRVKFGKWRKEPIEKKLKDICEMFPVVRGVDEISLHQFVRFIVGDIKLCVSPLVEEKDFENLRYIVLRKSLYEIPGLLTVRIAIEKLEEDIIPVGIPLANENKVGTLNGTKKILIAEISYPSGEITRKEVIDVKGFEKYTINPIRPIVAMLTRKVIGIIAKNAEEIAANAARGWLMKLMITDKDTVEKALEDFIKVIVRKEH